MKQLKLYLFILLCIFATSFNVYGESNDSIHEKHGKLVDTVELKSYARIDSVNLLRNEISKVDISLHKIEIKLLTIWILLIIIVGIFAYVFWKNKNLILGKTEYKEVETTSPSSSNIFASKQDSNAIE